MYWDGVLFRSLPDPIPQGLTSFPKGMEGTGGDERFDQDVEDLSGRVSRLGPHL